MNGEHARFAWDLFTELRKELVELQKIRAQIVGVKTTFIGAALTLLAARGVSGMAYTAVAAVAVFFDLMIQSYSFSIKRTGFYCREYLESILRAEQNLDPAFAYWEEFMDSDRANKYLGLWANFGITLLAASVATFALYQEWLESALPWYATLSALGMLAALLFYDATYHRRAATNFKRQERPLFAYRARPQVGVAVLIVNHKRSVLLGRRKNEPFKGRWDLVGGFIDPGESAEAAARREVREETTLTLEELEYLGSISDTYGDSNQPTLNICFTAKYGGGKPRPRSDVKELGWRSIDDPPKDLAFPHQEVALRLLRERMAAASTEA